MARVPIQFLLRLPRVAPYCIQLDRAEVLLVLSDVLAPVEVDELKSRPQEFTD
jgi:hypothetical protein